MVSFVSLIGALAWPVASFLIAALVRRELRLALNRLGQVKYAGMEVNFREEIRQAENLARLAIRPEASGGPAAPPQVVHEAAAADATELPGTLIGHEGSLGSTVLAGAGPRTAERPPKDADTLRHLVADSPRLAVLEAWDDLTHAALHAATILGDRRAAPPVRIESAARFLVERGWLTAAQGQLVDRLRLIAGRVERDDGATPDDARRFVDLVLPLLDLISSLA